MVISSFISSILVLALGIWSYMRLESSMNLFAERQLLIEPTKFSYKMWKDMPVSMYQSFTFFNLTNWNQVKAMGQKPRFVEVGPYVYKTLWSKTDVNFLDEEKLVNFGEKKQWHFQAHLSKGHEDDLIWTINTPLMTALALIQNAPVITRNIVSVILDGLGEGAFIKRPIRSLLFEGYSDLIVSVGPLFDRRFANFNGKFAYLYNKNDTIDGVWTVQTGVEDLAQLNKITRYQSAIVNMTSFSSGQMPQGLNEVKAECAPAWSLDQSTNGQLFAPFNRDVEQQKLQRQLQQIRARSVSKQQQEEKSYIQAAGSATAAPFSAPQRPGESIVQAPKRFFSRISSSVSSSSSSATPASNSNSNSNNNNNNNQPFIQQYQAANTQYADSSSSSLQQQSNQQNNIQDRLQQLKDFGKYIFYPDLCRPIHLLPSKQTVTSDNGIQASRYFIDPRVFMNSSQFPSNKCYEMNPRPPLANALAATINSVTGANVNVPNLVGSGSSPLALFIPPNNHHAHHNYHHQQHNENGGVGGGGLFERANHHPNSFLNNALQSLTASANQAADQLAGAASSNSPIGRLSRVRQLFTNIVSQRMSANPLLPSLAAGPASLLTPSHHHHHNHNHHHQGAFPTLSARHAAGSATPDQFAAAPSSPVGAQNTPPGQTASSTIDAQNNLSSPQAQLENLLEPGTMPQAPPLSMPVHHQQPPPGGSDRWITQSRFKWPRGVFSIGQCQLGAPIYVSLPHFLDADEYYLEQVDGLKPNRSLHEFYIDVESTLHSIPVGAKARLQLNIATPELRFRNIPNAMIPVLWQEVTFKIDKPIANMLYWSFNMSSSIYKLISVLLLLGGSLLMVFSFVAVYRRHRQANRISPTRVARSSSGSGSGSGTCGSNASQMCAGREQTCDRLSCTSSSHGSSTSDIVAAQSADGRSQNRYIKATHLYPAATLMRSGTLGGGHSSWRRIVGLKACCEPKERHKHSHCGHSSSTDEETHQHEHEHKHLHRQDDLKLAHHGAVLNHAFASSCNEIHLNTAAKGRAKDRRRGSEGSSEPVSSSESITTSRQHHSSSLSSPKQAGWSRASSHCGLMSSFGTTITSATNKTTDTRVACSRCLFSCLRHSPGQLESRVGPASIHANSADFHCETSDISSKVRQHHHHHHQQQKQQQQQQQQHRLSKQQSSASDIDKATLSSSRSSNLDSCSSIYTTRKSRKFK